MNEQYLSERLSQFLQARAIIHNLLRIGHLSSVGVKEVSISFPLLSALLAGLLLQHMLHTSVGFVSCNRFDPSVLVAGKSRSWAKVLVLVLKKKQKQQLLKKNGTYSATFTVVILHKAGNIYYLCMLLIKQLHWFNVNMSINHTY